jgi:hypothetical protein
MPETSDGSNDWPLHINLQFWQIFLWNILDNIGSINMAVLKSHKLEE